MSSNQNSDDEVIAQFEAGLAALPRSASAFANEMMTLFLQKLPAEMTQGYMIIQYLTTILGAEIMASFATKMLSETGVSAAKVNELRASFRAYVERKAGAPSPSPEETVETIKRLTKDWLN